MAQDRSIAITTDYITLDQAMKLASMVGSGGEAKTVILAERVTVNGVVETRRGKKLRPGDVFGFNGLSVQVAVASLPQRNE